jgi:cytochrome c oxidase cbb3-type subunit 3
VTLRFALLLQASFWALFLSIGSFTAFAQGGKVEFDAAAVARGKTQFKSSCGFCHGDDATGNRAPDLIRSPTTNHDVNGNLLVPIIRNGRTDLGMPAFATLPESAVNDIIVFLHKQAYSALHSANVPSDYPVAKLLTGDAGEGKAYFGGAGGCSGCHSPTGDLAKIASRYKPVDLQQIFVYPSAGRRRTATVTLPDGTTMEGSIKHADEFTVAIVGPDGWYHSWPRDRVDVEIHDSLAAHRALVEKYTDRDIHNLFAYLETLK